MEEICFGFWVIDRNLSHAKAAHTLEKVHHEFSLLFSILTLLILIDLDNFRLVEEHVFRLHALSRVHCILTTKLFFKQVNPTTISISGCFLAIVTCRGERHWSEAIGAR